MIAMPSSPLDNVRALRQIDFVMKNGQIIDESRLASLAAGQTNLRTPHSDASPINEDQTH